MMSSFFLIWRNQYIRRLIRNLVCQDVFINVDDEYLCNNQQYLSLFTNRDKLEYKISIRFMGKASDYLHINTSNRYLINDVELNIEEKFNLNEIHDGVHKLKLVVGPTVAGVGQLSDSITNLSLIINIDQDYVDIGDDSLPTVVQQVSSNLPCKLQELHFRNIGCIQSTCILPLSLTDLNYGSNYSGFKWLVVPPNRVYKNCVLDLDSIESFQWLVENKFICNVNINLSIVPLLKSQQLPSHVTEVHLRRGIVEPDLLLPQTVEYLHFSNYGTPFSHISHLKLLYIYDEYPIKLEKGVLPPSIESLNLTYNQPLEPGVLPKQLTSLYLYTFNLPLCVNVLPSSLTDLYLGYFNQPLNAFVLPQKLKKLCLHMFQQPTFLRNSLPVSLTNLTLYKFKGSFDQCQPLDNLKKLHVYSLVPSLAGLLTNVKKLDLWVDSKIDDPSGACLVNTSIESLNLISKRFSTFYPNSFPPTIKYLSIVNVVIETSNVIPNSCRYLKSRNREIDPKYIPPSARYYKSIQ
ncbi:hypothetical protein CYY_000250 [Polysphondylium violaceum]|uniref:FNIP repeat-containing protein n=1 Tax=Polysphondylium violaceum TaxID=133409 RepID=A0A8J4Q3A3_9MYCE|nr:hypothetical protein CYY_000250 [Polysphondylium violaceum]